MARRRTTISEPDVPPLPENLLTIDEVAKLLGVGKDMIRKLMRDEGLPHMRWGGHTLKFHPAAIARWLAEQSA